MKIIFQSKDIELIDRLVFEHEGSGEDYDKAKQYVRSALNQEQVIRDEVKSYFENKENDER